MDTLPINTVLEGDCIEMMADFPERSVDLIFADPPYNLQLSQELWRPNRTRVAGVDDAWDQFDSFRAYDDFTRGWLQASRRILKDDGTLWVIGSYHNIFRVGTILQDLGYWILNDVLWLKTNPMPNFRGVRFTNAHETLIWASKARGAKYTFNHHAMKSLNEDKQMRSDWTLPICNGAERLRENGKEAHSTQKPEALLYRVILASSSPGDVVLDPFFGTGTTGVVAQRLHRRWIGIEQEARYVDLARERIQAVAREPYDQATFDVRDRRRTARRVPFTRLLEVGLIRPGQPLYFGGDEGIAARVRPDGKLIFKETVGSIHQVAKHIREDKPCNGWDHWYFKPERGALQPIDQLRAQYRARFTAEG
jgi:modification methylase